MKSIWKLSSLVLLSASTLAVVKINNTSSYQPCFDTRGCDGEEICFQYFCYPKEGMETPLKSCRRNSQCKGIGNFKCFKPADRGVCVQSDDYEMCESHDECEGRGGKCCGDYCCNEEYFQELQKKECSDDDEVCLVRVALQINACNNYIQEVVANIKSLMAV